MTNGSFMKVESIAECSPLEHSFTDFKLKLMFQKFQIFSIMSIKIQIQWAPGPTPKIEIKIAGYFK